MNRGQWQSRLKPELRAGDSWSQCALLAARRLPLNLDSCERPPLPDPPLQRRGGRRPQPSGGSGVQGTFWKRRKLSPTLPSTRLRCASARQAGGEGENGGRRVQGRKVRISWDGRGLLPMNRRQWQSRLKPELSAGGSWSQRALP